MNNYAKKNSHRNPNNEKDEMLTVNGGLKLIETFEKSRDENEKRRPRALKKFSNI